MTIQTSLLDNIMTKVAFGFVLLPITYLIGFKLKNNSVNMLKNLGYILSFFGQFLNMVMLH